MISQDKLMKALTSGALLAFRPNLMNQHGSQTQEEISTRYLELKAMIQERYRQVDIDLLDIGPGSAERQEAMHQQLQEAGVIKDKEILAQAQKLLDLISEENADSLWASQVADPIPHLNK